MGVFASVRNRFRFGRAACLALGADMLVRSLVVRQLPRRLCRRWVAARSVAALVEPVQCQPDEKRNHGGVDR